MESHVTLSVQDIHKNYQTIGNIICTFKIYNMDLEDESPWERILPSTIFAIRSIVHTSIQHIPSQSIIDRDLILDVNQEDNWQLIKLHK